MKILSRVLKSAKFSLRKDHKRTVKKKKLKRPQGETKDEAEAKWIKTLEVKREKRKRAKQRKIRREAGEDVTATEDEPMAFTGERGKYTYPKEDGAEDPDEPAAEVVDLDEEETVRNYEQGEGEDDGMEKIETVYEEA